jgi:hypothetical protein
VEGTVTDLHDLADLRVGADLGELLSETSGVVGVLDGETLLEGNREGNEQVSRVVLVDPRLDLGEPGENEKSAVVEEESEVRTKRTTCSSCGCSRARRG